MTQHYQKNVCGILKYCQTCGRPTMHRVYNKRVGTCTETHVTGMSEKQRKQSLQPVDDEPSLF